MKKITTITALALAALSLSACGNTHHSSKDSAQEKENSSLKAENSSLKAKKKAQSSSSANNQSDENKNNQASASSSSNAVIKTPQDAAALVTHAMSVAPDIYHATPTNGGFMVTRDDMPDQSAIVHYDGSITWSNGDTQSYDSAAATTYNGGPSTFHPSN